MGLDDDQLTTDEAKYCLNILRRSPKNNAERDVISDFSSVLDGSIRIVMFKRLVQAAMIAPPKRQPLTQSEASSNWWVVVNGREQGPLDENSVRDLIAQGKVLKKTKCWQGGWEEWKEMGSIEVLKNAFPPKYKAHTSKTTGDIFLPGAMTNPEEIKKSIQKTAPQAPKTGYGSLYVETRPLKAEIFLDSKLFGKSPVTLRKIPSGSRLLKAEKKNFITGEKKIEVIKDEITKIALELKPAKGSVLVYSEPSGAEVLLDGKKADDKTPVSIKDIYAGKHQLKLSLSGYDTFKKTFEIIPDKTIEIDADFVKNKKSFADFLGMKFVYIEPGIFTMGSPSSDPDRNSNEEQHEVTLTQGYYMQTTEVTQGQWKSVMGSNPSYFKGDNLPVEQVSWNDVQKFIQKLNNRGDKITYRLPTEAEWEFAARARGESYIYSGSNDIDEVAWYNANSESKTHPVGTKKPNSLGLYDMSGNVWEWCEDIYDVDAYSKHARKNPVSKSGGSGRVFRGGCWYDGAGLCRSASRGGRKPGGRCDLIGFRLALSPGQ